MASEMVAIPADAIPDLRRMLQVGLACLGEVEHVRDHIELARGFGADVPGDLVPLHPTGAHEIGAFAEALMWLEHASPLEANGGER